MTSYKLCNQTVTVYHRASANEIVRTVYEHAFIDFRKNLNINKTGSAETNGFLLVVPGNTIACATGDKVILGEGPEITNDKEWGAFIPAKVDGLVVVKYVDPKYQHGHLVHTEAGG